MNLYLRLLRVVIHAFFRKVLGPLQTSITNYVVIPTDLDVNMHMTNSRYSSMMDIGRTDFIIRTGIYKKLWQKRLKPVIGAASIRWRKGLHLGQAFSLHTRILGWDDKWYYIEQRFMCKGRSVCYGIVKATFRGPHGVYSPVQLAKEIDPNLTSPPLHDILDLWNNMLDQHRDLVRQETGEHEL